MASSSRPTNSTSETESEAEAANEGKKLRRTSRLSLPTTKKRESLETTEWPMGTEVPPSRIDMVQTKSDAGAQPPLPSAKPPSTATTSKMTDTSSAAPAPSTSRESLVADYSSSVEPASSATEESDAGSPPRRLRRSLAKLTRYGFSDSLALVLPFLFCFCFSGAYGCWPGVKA